MASPGCAKKWRTRYHPYLLLLNSFSLHLCASALRALDLSFELSLPPCISLPRRATAVSSRRRVT